ERETQILQFVEQHATRMHQLLGALQQYIYVSESGYQELVNVDCNLSVQSAVVTLQSAIQESKAKIERQKLPMIPSIDILMVQVFQNLIANAIKYRSEGTPLIHISSEAVDNGWIFSVEDNGIGIDPKYHDYVFGVFKRLDGNKNSGTGIGLAICRAAVERLGGRIWVQSKPGQGSTFQFFLPNRTA